jgi:glutamate carboxypeptidase
LNEWLEAAEPDLLVLLEELVNIDSGSGDRRGIARVSAVLEAYLRRHHVSVDHICADEGYKLLHARVSEAPAADGVLLLGHMDTVFPTGTAAQRPFRMSDGMVFGPGVADMKAGLVMNAALLSAFKANAWDKEIALSALFTVDEEVGSKISRPHIEAISKRQRIVLNAEPARANGDVVGKRKGGVFVRLETEGMAAHSGVDLEAGASAIEEIAQKAREIYEFARKSHGLTANIGQIGGGTAINTVPDHAFLLADIRYSEARQLDEISDWLAALASQQVVARTATAVRELGRFNPMETTPQNEQLAKTYVSTARELGVDVGIQATGGCSDAGFPSSLGIATLCGVGPVGGAAHTVNEYVVADSIVVRAKIAASTIARTMAGRRTTQENNNGGCHDDKISE